MPLVSALKQLYHDSRRKAEKIVRRWRYPISHSDIVSALQTTIGEPCDILMVHSSLSRCGYIVDGPAAVISALGEFCNTLCMPTHTYCYSQDDGAEAYDPRRTMSKVGSITNYFWNQEGVERSVHPTHSLAARGPHAQQLCTNHHVCDTACGLGTPYMRLIEADASVLMFGATMNTYTLFHCSEDVVGCEYLYEAHSYKLKALGHDGTPHELQMRRQDMAVPRRFTEMREELLGAGLLKAVTFGANELLYIPSSAAVHEYTVERLQANEYHLVKAAENTSV